VFCINFTQNNARDYMNFCYMKKELSPKTFNSYISGYHSIFSWFVEYGYCKVNVFTGIRRKKEMQKFRTEISTEIRNKIQAYLMKNGMGYYWLMCELCFYCLIRPAEMVRIKVENVDLEKQIIVLKADETKNKNERIATVPDHMINLLKKHIDTRTGKLLFSNVPGWQPGTHEIDSREISRKWAKLRDIIHFPSTVQFYSQRDSGIIYLLDCDINPEYVRTQADHFSLAMTTKYSKHYRPEGVTDLKKITPRT
jgi:integrase/recombinase XerD